MKQKIVYLFGDPDFIFCNFYIIAGSDLRIKPVYYLIEFRGILLIRSGIRKKFPFGFNTLWIS
ncbi:hypothetical protein DW241_08765 [Hungatella hathewayi]|nr:hypothetical protein DW241_08765 [Hungatella hathewayi]